MTIERDYLPALRLAYPGKPDPQIELLLAGNQNVRRRASGLDANYHRKMGMEKLWPQRVWHDWRDERMQAIQHCLEHGIQELMWMGSANSNKSADMADAALGLWWQNPDKTSIYVTSPYETATETGLWSYITEQFHDARDLHPKLPGRVKLSDNSIVLYDRNPRAFIRVATVDQIGKLVGKKSRDFGEGFLIILADELPAFSNVAAKNFVRVLANLWSVPNILVIGAGNFARRDDALGILCEPDERDIPGGYEGFNADLHFRWRTARGGLCQRFDGLQSPNVKAGRDLYPFVTTIKYIAKMAAQPGGLQSPDSMRFVRSAPVTSLEEFTVTNGERIRAGGCYDPVEWTGDPIQLLAFADPGFGGDPCVFHKFKLGRALLKDGNSRQTLLIDGEPEIIPIRVGLKDAQGVEVPGETQVARGVKALCEKHRIPFDHCGYDGSMRAALGQAMALHCSPQVIALDTQGPATSRPFSATERDEKGEIVPWNKKVDRFLSELWFAAAVMIDSAQLRGLFHSKKAAMQLCTRQWDWSGKKKKVQTKLEYRDMLIAQGKKGESPNEADALVGGIEIARRLGLSLEGYTPGGGSLALILEMIEHRKERESYARFYRPKAPERLPSGRLRGIARANAGRAKLHR